MVLSNPLPGATTRPPDTQQLPPSQPIIQQLQASIETVAPSSSSEHPSSLSSPSASCCPQNMQQSLIDVTLGNESAVSLKALFLFPVPITIATLPGAGVTIGHLLQCHSSGARCTACKCCREEHPCVNCYPRRPLAEPRQPLDLSLLSNSAPPVTPIRKRCTIEGCTALIAPSMWRIHMSLHASGALPVANTRQASHLQHCSQNLTNQIAHLQSSIAPEPQINQNLPTFEEQRGVVNPHTSIESLCQMWLNNDLVTLWSMSLTRANLNSSSKNFGTPTHSQEIYSAISLGRSGLMGKACRILLSSGIAPSNSTTLNLLQSKNPSCPHSTIPDIASNPVTLGPSFDILHILRSFTKGTSAGPSGLSIQHLLDPASVPLRTPICDSLKGVVNILTSGKAPKSVSGFLSGGRLIALNKGNFSEGQCTDIRPIVVGEELRRLTGKCLCSILRDKFSTFFQPSQFGVACKAGVERVVHNLRKCIDDGWMSGDFVVCKVDMSNAFNRVSRQAVLDECSSFFPELLPWVSWCYGSHSLLWHSMGTISSQSGVQQGDPLGPMLFALVLHKLVSSIEADDDCINLSFNAWYLDDGILVGECEVFSRNGISLFPASVKSSILPNLEILGAPIGDIVHCSRFFAEKHNDFKVLLGAISDVAAVDLHVAISLLPCAKATANSLKFFDEEVRLCFSSCVAIDVPDTQWQQAQLSPKLGGHGLRSLALHSCAAFISSVASLEMGNPDNTHLQQAILRFNARVSPQDSITMESVLNSPPQQKSLSQKLDSFAFHSLLSSASLVNKACMLSVSSPHASSWITAIPSTSLKLHLDSAEYQTAIRWWLGLNTSEASPCPFCPELVLDPLGHHAASCRHGGDVVTRHNRLRDIFVEFCRQAHLSVRVEAGFGLSRVQRNTRPADVLVQDWVRGSPAAIDITVTSPLTPAMLRDASTSAGSAAYTAECRKHEANDTKCPGAWMDMHSSSCGDLWTLGERGSGCFFPSCLVYSHPSS
eukprot:Em0260g3a